MGFCTFVNFSQYKNLLLLFLSLTFFHYTLICNFCQFCPAFDSFKCSLTFAFGQSQDGDKIEIFSVFFANLSFVIYIQKHVKSTYKYVNICY